MPTLPIELRQALDAHPEEPLSVLDERTNTAYVLLRADAFERLRARPDADLDPSAAYPLADETFAEGWDDPRMSDYDHYEEFKR